MSYGCVICSEVFSSTDGVNNYPVCVKNCGHSFHNACLRQWLEKSKTCPVCRTPTCDSASCVFRLHLTTMKVKKVEDWRKEVEELRRFREQTMTYITDIEGNMGQMNRTLSHIKIELGLTGSENDSVIDLSDDPPAQVTTPPVVVPPVVTRATRRNQEKVPRRQLTTIAHHRCAPTRGRSTSSSVLYRDTR